MYLLCEIVGQIFLSQKTIQILKKKQLVHNLTYNFLVIRTFSVKDLKLYICFKLVITSYHICVKDFFFINNY